MEFQFETDPDTEPDRPWWFICELDEGGYAIGGGATPWDAFAACLADFPRARTFNKLCDDMLRDAKAGIYRCPGCDVLRPQMTDETSIWAPFCDSCRGDEG